MLNEHQKKHGLHIANKLTDSYVDFKINGIYGHQVENIRRLHFPKLMRLFIYNIYLFVICLFIKKYINHGKTA